MTSILLFGAGKSASVLIDYLVAVVQKEDWQLTVVDSNLELVQQKLAGAPNTTAASFDIIDAAQRKQIIEQANLVISLLPPTLHILVAKDCIACKKNLLTASYVDAEMKKLEREISAAGVFFLCEMGLDPGIDHMSAKAMINDIHESGGKIKSFHSHCGGLVAPESDDNPWHYKISWNPRNVVLAGKAGAVYKQNGVLKKLDYRELFTEIRFTNIVGLAPLCWYPNRDSLSYLELYNLPHCHTFVRTTLRHPDFITGWKNIIDLMLTDETLQYKASGRSLKELFKEHLSKHTFDDNLKPFSNAKKLAALLLKHIEQEDKNIILKKAPRDYSDHIHDINFHLKQLLFLGLDDAKTILQKEWCSPADMLQDALEKNLALKEHERDMVVMQHEIEFEKEHKTFKRTSTLVVKGTDNQRTAMAKTVGLPLGIAATLILKDVIACKGLQIPVSKEIYEPVLAALQLQGIQFLDEETAL